MATQGEGDLPVTRTSERVRTLTEKGNEQYKEHLERHNGVIDTLWKEIETLLFDFDEKSAKLRPKELTGYEKSVLGLHGKFIEASTALSEFLDRTNTEESILEKKTHLDRYSKRRGIVERFIRNLQDRLLDTADSVSQKLESDTKSTKSTRSSLSDVLLRKQIKVEGQRTRLRYLEQEINLVKQKAHLDADLRLLEQQRETAVAEAEVDAIKGMKNLVMG
ncbi:hypothetical protein FSP39_023422 [Pinctada imbricata]|uniref:Uncharacterized protein n=1 Tax=Pinctada imbricata TaxID=66713 RepID=A0AA89C3T9_PINIB|nr:hypothetical protein FSP39_023422 [Pinctada imbricata]